MLLYDNRTSGNCYKVRLLFAHLGLEYERRELDVVDRSNRLEAHLEGGAFLVGQRYSIADIALYAYTHVAGEGGFELEPYPAIRTWLARVAAQHGHVLITD
jgi:glutathione S-transferase